MRKKCFELIEDHMINNNRIHFLTSDLGYGFTGNISKFVDRFHNFGAAEQLMIGAGIGLTNSGKIAICYSMTPFILSRPHEWLRNYVNNEKIALKLIGSGADYCYLNNGFTHFGVDRHNILNGFKNIKVIEPTDSMQLENDFDYFLYSKSPCFLCLKR